MSLKVNIDHNFHDLDDMMQDLGVKDISGAARTSINKALTTGVKETVNQVRKDLNLKSGAIKKRIIVNKARGGNMSNMSGEMVFSGIPISMMEFVVGKKSNIQQKGIAVRKRRKLKARIAPGKTFHIKGGFIQDIKSRQVFRRKGDKRRVRKLGQASLAVIAFRQPRRKMIELALVKRFNEIFNNQINWRWNKTSHKYSSSRMKKL